jgi:hypothetical protein
MASSIMLLTSVGHLAKRSPRLFHSSSATRTSWLRVHTPVFRNSCCNADFTEASEMVRLAAISLLLQPENTPFSNWRSRSDSSLGRMSGLWLSTASTNARTQQWSIRVSPVITRSIAWCLASSIFPFRRQLFFPLPQVDCYRSGPDMRGVEFCV